MAFDSHGLAFFYPKPTPAPKINYFTIKKKMETSKPIIDLSDVFKKDTANPIFARKFQETEIYAKMPVGPAGNGYMETQDLTTDKAFMKYVFSQGLGLSFFFNEVSTPDVVKEIYVYNKDKKFSTFSYEAFQGDTRPGLPYNLDLGWTNGEFVSYFGEPDEKSGGKEMPICLGYERLGFECNFDAYNWETKDAHLEFIVLFPPKPREADKMECCVCCKVKDKPAKKCARCGVVFYCGADCQTRHWASHKPFC